MPPAVKEHLSWIADYCACATDDNWRDILLRIKEQLRRAEEDAKNWPAK